jgi:hypothetical protein
VSKCADTLAGRDVESRWAEPQVVHCILLRCGSLTAASRVKRGPGDDGDDARRGECGLG